MMHPVEKILIRFIGRSVMDGRIFDLHHDIFFFLILILVFVSRMLVGALQHLRRGRIAPKSGLFTITSLFLGIFYVASTTTADCATGNEPDRNGGASGSGTTGPSCSSIEEELSRFLSSYRGRGAPRQTHFDAIVKELQLASSDAEDKNKMLLYMEECKAEKNITSRGEASARLLEKYSTYFQKKYGKSLWV